jgi:polyketide synthase 12
MSQMHIRMLLGQMDLGDVNLDMLAVQLTGALDGPLLLYLSASDLTDAVPHTAERIAQSWQDLVQRICRP